LTNVGIIGLGKMGQLHLMNCFHIDGVKVVAAADQSKSSLRKAQLMGVQNLYSDYHDLIDASKDIDAVVISLPNFLHFESVKSALEAGLDVFLEKPMARTVEECHEIVKLVRKSGRAFMVDHCVRFFDTVERMKVAVEKGYIGSLEVITLEDVINGPFSHGLVPAPVPEWWFDPEKSGGGALLDLGYHLVDLFRFFAGDSKLEFCILDHKYNLPVEDGAIMILSSDKASTKGIINVGWYQQAIFPSFNFRVILHGNAGYISSDDLEPSNFYLHAAKEGTKNVLRRLLGRRIRPLSYTYYYESFYKSLKHFFSSRQNDPDSLESAMDGTKNVDLITQAYTTLKNSR
jgi:predicted dehydrogenase